MTSEVCGRSCPLASAFFVLGIVPSSGTVLDCLSFLFQLTLLDEYSI